MLKQIINKKLLNQGSLNTEINLPTNVKQSCFGDSLVINQDAEITGNVQMSANADLHSLSIKDNFVVKGSANFTGNVVTRGSINMQGNSVLNVPSPKNLTDGISLQVLKQTWPQCYTATTGIDLWWWWDAHGQYNWVFDNSIVSSINTDRFFDYCSINDNNQIRLNIPGVYRISVCMGKSGESGNGYGGFLQLQYTSNNQTKVIGSAGLLNSGVVNAQGVIQACVVIKNSSDTGFLTIANNNSHGFRLDYFCFSITVYPYIEPA